MNAPEVIKALNVYIVNNNLQEIIIKQLFHDEKLANLLKIEDGHQLTYFNIQKYLSKHYLKTKLIIITYLYYLSLLLILLLIFITYLYYLSLLLIFITYLYYFQIFH